jgi:hypothetical protein
MVTNKSIRVPMGIIGGKLYCKGIFFFFVVLGLELRVLASTVPLEPHLLLKIHSLTYFHILLEGITILFHKSLVYLGRMKYQLLYGKSGTLVLRVEHLMWHH